ncbi:hypothetical protein QTN47_08410 [Danxiaibacter flavus]|uniref:Glycosyltransferase RgtA/B/C/D-like domain-containing protein n=1 Tax=Danxiaibacter flavus TaxID=3049108 RepID=A0ABV3ZE82_9BACT|nr:hypothetical protein QNM32_08410 [Chitinophagaceae bacterium DXS]
MTTLGRSTRIVSYAEFLLIIVFALLPLFGSYPFRINIFLSWDGAYRMSHGQIPFKDFGMPLGFGYWIIPAFFMKIFGPAMITLVKAQSFINIISGFAFLSILKSFRIPPYSRILVLLVYIVSYSMLNFWPWYNNTVIIYEIIGLAFLFKYLLPKDGAEPKNYWLILAAVFTFLSFFTKQDGGGLALMLCIALLIYHCILHKKVKPLLIFIASYAVFAGIIIIPLLKYGFGYWFNHGQPPHSTRLSLYDLFNRVFAKSEDIKFYVLLCVLLLIPYFKSGVSFLRNERLMLFALLTFGILTEAAIFQFTSYVPANNNIFFHAFAFAFILMLLNEKDILLINNGKQFVLALAAVLLWWSAAFWKYIDPKIQRAFPPSTATISPTGENIINEHTYRLNADTFNYKKYQSGWTFSSVPVFRKISMPASTVEGIDRLMHNPEILSKIPNNRILNMTELTPLSYAMGFGTERGSEYPLWYHLGVGMYNKQKDMYCNKIAQHYYDVVLYEYIPNLNNFYPFAVRDALRANYQLIDSFDAPRLPPALGTIEVYVKPSH